MFSDLSVVSLINFEDQRTSSISGSFLSDPVLFPCSSLSVQKSSNTNNWINIDITGTYSGGIYEISLYGVVFQCRIVIAALSDAPSSATRQITVSLRSVNFTISLYYIIERRSLGPRAHTSVSAPVKITTTKSRVKTRRNFLQRYV